MPATLDNLRRNVARLQPPAAAARCEVAHLDWHAPAAHTAAAHGGAELILAADCVYDPSLGAPLLTTISALLHAAPGARTLLAAERRGAEWATFEALLDERRAALCVADRSGAARAALRLSLIHI